MNPSGNLLRASGGSKQRSGLFEFTAQGKEVAELNLCVQDRPPLLNAFGVNFRSS